MNNVIALQADFEKPELLEKAGGLIYFSKKSPSKDTCNEDALALIEIQNGFVLAVADGAGGHPKGEEAAALVLNNLKKHVTKSNPENMRSSIVDAIETTNKELIKSGVGARTTVTVCEIQNNIARGYQVGDSTMMICGQKGKLKYRSLSHSPVGYAVEAGLIDDKEALAHPDLHYISNLLGEVDMKIEIGPEVELNSNDTVFLASDGIFDNFQPNEIIEIVRKGSIQEVASCLIENIQSKIYDNEQSKKDDVSFIVFRNDSTE